MRHLSLQPVKYAQRTHQLRVIDRLVHHVHLSPFPVLIEVWAISYSVHFEYPDPMTRMRAFFAIRTSKLMAAFQSP